LELHQTLPAALAHEEAANSKSISVVRRAPCACGIHRKEKRGGTRWALTGKCFFLKNAVVEGIPAELIARQQTIGILVQENQPETARAEAASCAGTFWAAGLSSIAERTSSILRKRGAWAAAPRVQTNRARSPRQRAECFMQTGRVKPRVPEAPCSAKAGTRY